MCFSRFTWLSKIKMPSPLSGDKWYESTETKPFNVEGSNLMQRIDDQHALI